MFWKTERNTNMTSIFSGLAWDDGFGGDPENYELFFGTDNPPTNIKPFTPLSLAAAIKPLILKMHRNVETVYAKEYKILFHACLPIISWSIRYLVAKKSKATIKSMIRIRLIRL